MPTKPKTEFDPLIKTKEFRERLCSWFSKEGKSYPWRETSDPWAILVSEIMLQQTTVASVIANSRFELFLNQFPDVKTMAEAEESDLLKAWEGLGYYNRVRNLQRAAQAILADHQGRFPKDAAILRSLAGIGPYTAGAVSSFAFDQAAPIVDANIARVLSRVFNFSEPVNSTAGLKQVWEWAAALLDTDRPRIFNSALMELGQTYCSVKNPDCHACPIAPFCHCPAPLALPVKKAGQKVVKAAEHAIFDQRNQKLLMAQEKGGRRKGFWRLPLRDADEMAHLEASADYQYAITRYRVTLHLYNTQTLERAGEQWIEIDRLDSIPIPSPVRRVIEAHLKR